MFAMTRTWPIGPRSPRNPYLLSLDIFGGDGFATRAVAVAAVAPGKSHSKAIEWTTRLTEDEPRIDEQARITARNRVTVTGDLVDS